LSRGDQLKELASDLSHAAEAARRLGLSTTVYLLSMALVEVREAPCSCPMCGFVQRC
jgi:hypothetical protein